MRRAAGVAVLAAGVALTASGAVLSLRPAGAAAPAAFGPAPAPAAVGSVPAALRTAPTRPAPPRGAGVPTSAASPTASSDPTRAASPTPGATTPSAPVPVGVQPVRVSIGGSSAPVVPVGVAPDGGVLVPEDPRTVGWWAAGPLPGGPGGAVLVGHVDARGRGVGTLAALWTARPGERVELTGADGTRRAWTVAARRSYPKAALPDSTFDASGPSRLVLVTCGGAFDAATGHYADNVVVDAVPAAT